MEMRHQSGIKDRLVLLCIDCVWPKRPVAASVLFVRSFVQEEERRTDSTQPRMGWCLRIVGLVALVAAALPLLLPEEGAAPADSSSTSAVYFNAASSYLRLRDDHAALQRQWLLESTPLLRGQTIVLTGATRGLGRGVAATLVAMGADVILPCRKVPRDLAATVHGDARMLLEQAGAPKAKERALGKVDALQMDLSDLDSVDDAVEALASQFGKGAVDAVINNAGLINPNMYLTKQGFELTFGVNFLGTARFTLGLIDADVLRSGGNGGGAGDAPPTILSISSQEHMLPPFLNETGKPAPFGTPWGSGMADSMLRYSVSKLAQVTFFMELAEQHPEIRVLDTCPGAVGSEIASDVSLIGSLVQWAMEATFPTVYHAAISVVKLLVDPSVAGASGEGQHFFMGDPIPARSDARDPATRKWLWAQTLQLLKDRAPPSA